MIDNGPLCFKLPRPSLGAIFEAGRAPATAALAVAAVRFRAKLAGQPAPAGEATARVLGGFRRTAADRGRGQAAPLRADGLAAILATAARPRTDGRGVESPTTAHRRGRLDAVIASLLFMGGLRRSEVSALEWRDVTDARDGDGVLLTVRTSKTNQEGAAADVRYLKNGAAKAIRTLRAADADAAPTDRVVGLSPLQIQRRFTAAARAAGHRGARDGAQWPGRARVRTDGARRVHHGSHAGRQPARPPNAGPSESICKGGDGGTARQQYGINRASLRDEFPLSGDRVPHRRTTATPQHAGAWSLQGDGCLFVLLARRVRHVRQILNPLRDIRHALHRRDVHAERPSRPEKVRTIIRRQAVMRPRGDSASPS